MRASRYTAPVSKLVALLGLALLAASMLWLWLGVRKYAARRRLQEQRATALLAQAIQAAAKARGDTLGTARSPDTAAPG
jgi:type II secretory pathway pseudopilin PulG